MFKYQSINFKLVSLIIFAFVFTAVSVVWLAYFQLTRIIDNSQAEIYSGRLNTITNEFERRYKLLEDTLLVETYEEDFQEAALRDISSSYYTDSTLQQAYPFIVDGQGIVVLHPELQPDDGTLRQQSFMQEMINQQTGSFNYTDQGVATWAIFTYFEPWDWIVIYTIPLEIKYTDARQFISILVVIMGGVALLATAVLWIMISRFTKPIVKLTDVAAELQVGKLDIPIETGGQDEVGRLAAGFVTLRDALREYRDNMEERVADRTARLEILADLSESLNAILDFDQLLNELVNQVKDKFGYYHAHIYILDTQRQALVMTAGVGEAGAKMKAQDHHIPLETSTSLVVRAARTGQIVNIPNVRQAADWLPNPLLPDTYSEMAVPIIVEGQMAGVLDVQQNKIAGFDEADADLLRSLANQVAIAIRNARLFEAVETALAEAQLLQERYVTQVWDKNKISAETTERMYIRPGSIALPEASLTQAKQQALSHDDPTLVTLDSEEMKTKSIVAPVMFSGKKIGALQLHQLMTDNPNYEWQDDDLALVQAVLDQVAQTAENLRLFEETQERANREHFLGQVADKLRQAPDMETLFQTGLDEIANALQVDRAFVHLGELTQPASLEDDFAVNGNASTD
jgi:GAF domain-containing protein/HAMP domain-containing protein